MLHPLRRNPSGASFVLSATVLRFALRCARLLVRARAGVRVHPWGGPGISWRRFRLLVSRFGVGALAVFVLALSALVVASSADSGPSSVLGRKAAVRSGYLGAARHGGAEIVFGLPKPIAAGAVVADAGPARPGLGGASRRSSRGVIARLKRPAWLFYEDLAPFEQYQHPGRVALVDVRTGRVTVSRSLLWPPVVDGRRPPFLRSAAAYDGRRYRVFYRPYVGSGAVAASVGAVRGRATVDSMLAGRVASLLASEHACTVRVSDTVMGGFYAFAERFAVAGGSGSPVLAAGGARAGASLVRVSQLERVFSGGVCRGSDQGGGLPGRGVVPCRRRLRACDGRC